MNTRVLLAAAIAAALPVLAAERVDRTQLPPAVRKTLDEATQGEPIKQITVRHATDRAVYDIELERSNAANSHVRINETGELISDTRNTPATEAPLVYPDGVPGVVALPRLRLDELPRTAQQTIQREAAGREIAAIHEDAVEGRKAYAVQFRERGRNPWLYVAEDGTILRPMEKPPVLGFGTTLSDTPGPVREAIRREVGGGEIERIDKERTHDAPETYKISVKDARGTYQLRISADGRVLEKTRATERPAKRG